MTKFEKRRGRIQIIGFILVLILVIVSLRLFVQNSSRKVTSTAPTAHAEAVESTKVPEVVSEPIQEQTVAVEAVQPEQRLILDNDAKAFIYQHESGNCPTKWQGEYGQCPAYHGVPTDPRVGYGLCQSTPADKMSIMGEGWETSWDLQDQWCTMHADGYGGWQNAYYHWLSHGNW